MLYGKLRPYLNKVVIADDEGVCSTEIIPIKGYAGILNKYIKYVLKRSDFLEYTEKVTYGTKMPRLGTKDGQRALFPMAPIEEQHRIVERIEALLAQVDELEQRVQQDQEIDERLQVAILDDLQSAETPEASKQSWQRLTDHFDQIYRKPEHIDQLKQAILNEAVRGRLVPQNPNDEPADNLLEHIKEEKQRLYEEGEIRKPKDLPDIADGEIPYELPENWTWNRLGDLCFDIHYGHTTSADEAIQTPKFLRITDINNNTVNWDTVPGCEIEEENISKYELEDGDILIARTGGTIGKSFLVENVEEQAIFASYLIRLIPHNFTLAKYLRRFLDSAFYWYQIDESKKGTGQPNVNATKLGELLFPLPPADEQKRIVNKADELLNWCDGLKEKLSRSQQTDQRLLEALVNGALEDKQEESKESDEATIYQMPNSRLHESEVAKLTGISSTDAQAGMMCRILVLSDKYQGKKEHFGRTKMEKANHVIESHAKIDLGRRPKRMARGAADFKRLVNKVEYKAEKKGWFNVSEIDGAIHYKKGTRFIEPFRKLDIKLGVRKSEVDRIINLFIPLTTREAEVRQTVYAAWHDLIAYGKEPIYEEIVKWSSTEQYWAKEKENIPKEEFYEAIDWLRENDLIPDGKGKLTLTK